MPITPMLLHWRFGPDWPGRRCGAKTRGGTPCQKAALKGNARCQLHGGRGGAPTGARNGNYRHGRFTKEAMAEAKEQRQRLKEVEGLARSLGMFRSASDERLAKEIEAELRELLGSLLDANN